MKRYQLDLRLRRLAAIQISKHLWTQQDIKKTLKLHTKDNETCESNHSIELQDLYDKSKSIFTQILRKIDELILPEPAKNELIFVVGSMGSKMFNWLEEIKYEKDSLIDLGFYIDHICWTDHGCINWSETLRSLYLSKSLPEDYETWQKLCNNFLDDCIRDLWPKVSSTSKYFNEMNWLRFVGFKYHHIYPFYWDCRMRNDLREIILYLKSFPNHIKVYEEDHSMEENMFRVSVVNCNYPGVKYFWGLLDDEQKLRTISKLSERPIHYDPIMEKCKYVLFEGGEHDTDLVIFLLQQLSFYRIDNLLIMMLGSGFVLRKLLNWPWQDLFMNVLEESWKHHKSIDYESIVMEILYSLHKQYETVGIDFKYRRIFFEIWKRNPDNLKMSIDYLAVLHELWEMKDVGLLKCIINDEDLEERREDFLDYEVKLFRKSPDDFDFLEKFVNQVLLSDDERNGFKCKILSPDQ